MTYVWHPTKFLTLLLLAGFLATGCGAAIAGEPSQAYLIRLDKKGLLTVISTRKTDKVLGQGERGLLLWAEESGERWRVLPASGDKLLAPSRSGNAILLNLPVEQFAGEGATLNRIRSGGTGPLTGKVSGDATNIPEIDELRELIATNQWSKARAALRKILTGNPFGRRCALALLYRGVLFAEAGPYREEDALRAFRSSLELIKRESPADRFRVHNNFANFLVNCAEDRLDNLASEAATGVPYPFLTALRCWIEAENHYLAAKKLGSALGPHYHAVACVNHARLYTLLAHMIETLDQPTPNGRRFSTGEKAAFKTARKLAEQAAKLINSAGSQPQLLAAIEEVYAHVAFHSDDIHSCHKHASHARAAHAAARNLLGVESAERLLGLCHRHISQTTKNANAKRHARQQALKHFMKAEELAEQLRRRFPVGRIGRSRAGFFARRAYVYEMLVELLLAEGNDVQALHYADLAKARALHDALAANLPLSGNKHRGENDVNALLRRWPSDIASLEYFVGSEHAWVFVINPAGKVTTCTLKDKRGKAVAPQALIARVHRFLVDIDHQARKMAQRINNDRGFDHSWQDTLHEFYGLLIPHQARKELRRAKTVLILPHHVLHYFPFAALVTQPDTAKRGPMEMVKPRFLIDEPFALCHAASLADWNLLRQRKNRPLACASAVGVPDLPGAVPLPGVRKDVQNLKAAFGTRTKDILLDEAATEKATWELLAKPGLLLFATHGTVVPDRSLQSRLYLFPDAEHNGWLTAAELYGKKTGADMVVLSACYSGLADRNPLPGDELFGLQRAFLRAGTRTAVAGLWDVYDGTGPELTRGLFQGLANGKAAPAALADAQRTFLNELRRSKEAEPWLHPYFWAVYTVNGDDRTGH